MIDIYDKKVQKRILRLVFAVARSSDSDCVLLSALASIELCMRDSKNNDHELQIDCEQLMAHITNNRDLMKLLDK